MIIMSDYAQPMNYTDAALCLRIALGSLGGGSGSDGQSALGNDVIDRLDQTSSGSTNLPRFCTVHKPLSSL